MRKPITIQRPRVGMALAALGLAALAAGCGPQTAAAPAPTATTVASTPTAALAVATSTVATQNFAFGPPAITVPVGTTVTWTNDDLEEHTVTALDKSFDSGAVADAGSFHFTFAHAGSFQYYCAIHPNMLGTVVVTAK